MIIMIDDVPGLRDLACNHPALAGVTDPAEALAIVVRHVAAGGVS